ncbi:Por secretion system C-terminal sorting domain-containing protein [Ekhidna lutea]|uniref:Por secretion system C-terminal sorting domain-containing protein n=1 Tax=Ekhidna lutea TaxID=447679 RepID=A0A239IJ50_EKHLU|nr:fibronectin type III domain-containing protein [Ekhidna lutea]SNS93585.1 Por secretion system C-terminal sorting domain-containing protein [Ekhidna lutea]
MKNKLIVIAFLAMSFSTWSQTPTYKWVSGSQETRKKSILNATEPGPRNGHFTFSDDDDNLWLFGGSGQDFNTTSGYFNDIWKYDQNSKTWSWIDGQETVDIPYVENNNSLLFDGIDDYIIFNSGNYPIATVPYEMTDVTVEFWFKTTQHCPILAYGNINEIESTEWEIKVENSGEALGMYRGAHQVIYIPNLDLANDEWHHLAFVTKEGDDIFIEDLLFVYLDGELIGQELIHGNNPFTVYNEYDFLMLGARIGDGYSEFFKGQIDELRFWDYARSQSQVATSRFRELNINEEGITAYYKFNQGEANSANNSIDILEDNVGGNFGSLVNFGRDIRFDGEMAQVRLFNTVKNAQEIAALAQTPVTGASPDIVNAYDFAEGIAEGDNTSLTNINDIASFDYDGELHAFDLSGSESNYRSDYMKVLPSRYSNFTGGRDIILVDVNNDTYEDVLTTNFDEQSISVLINDQSGAFGAATEFSTGSQSNHITTGFFNNDAFPDVAVTTEGDNPGDDKVRLFFGDGAGGFSSFTDFPLSDDAFPGRILADDLNDDTFDDLVVILPATQTLAIYYGDGAGGYITNEFFSVGPYYNFGLEIDDFTNDGWLDIVISTLDQFGHTTIGLLRNNTAGSFDEMVTTEATASSGYLQVTEFKSTDINDDGNKDLIFIDGSSFGSITGNGDGTFQENYRGELYGNTFSGIEIMDVNADNIFDIIASSNESNKLLIFHGNVEGEFTLATSINITSSSEDVAISDLDKNGQVDIAISHYADVSITLRENNDLNQSSPVNTLRFDGVDDYVNIPDFSTQAADPNIFNDDFTWEGWIKTSDNGPIFSITTDLYDNGWPTADRNSFALFIANNKLSLNQDGQSSGSVETIEDYDITDGEWHHVAFSVTSAYPSNVVFYLDGIQLTSDYTADDGINTIDLDFSSFDVDNMGYAGRLGYVRPNFIGVFNSPINQALTSNWTDGFDIPIEKPGRAFGAGWTDENGNFNVFGGQGVLGIYNSIRQYNPETNQWSILKGVDEAYYSGSYGTIKVSEASNMPPSRWLMDGALDQDGNFWVFGGGASENPIQWMNDLWMYDPLISEWVWVSGSENLDEWPTHGTKGISDPINMPGARENHQIWIDSENNIWLFGGYGPDSEGTIGHLNDLWKYDPSTDEWTWISGTNLANQKGIFGALGEYSADFRPGGRAGYNQWMDSNGIFWIFDGQGYDKFGISSKYLNDLWSFDPTTEEWAWHSGSDFASSTGSYNEKGLSSVDYVPGARWHSNIWVDKDDNLWMFGGNFPNQITTGQYNDLWKYEPSSNEWTWVSGFNSTATADELGTYGDLGAGSQPTPGGRNGALRWTDLDGNLWIQGGAYIGGNINGNVKDGYLNDLWKFSVSKNIWTYFGGNTEIETIDGEYGSRGIGNALNVPRDRWHGASWTGQDGKLWFFGGIHFNNAIDDIGWLNDLWNYDPESQVYTWMAGSSELNASGVYGTKGEPSVGHIPGPRSSAAYWSDHEGNFYLFGGYESFQFNNDLWKFNPNTLEWTWLSGNSFQNTPGSYGEKGISDPDNLIGARRYMDAQIDQDGAVWFFGGQGYDSEAQFGYLNDLWKYDPSSNQWTWISGPNLINQAPSFGIKGVASLDNLPPARYGHDTWMDDSGNLWIFGGVGVIEIDGELYAGYLNDLWKYDTKLNLWTWVGGSEDFNVVANYGSQGVFDELNTINSRQRAHTFGPIDKSLWLFGGRKSTQDSYNDLWEIKFIPGVPVVDSPQDIRQDGYSFSSDEAWTRSYQVQVSLADDFGETLYDETSSNKEAVINNLDPGTNYYYRVNAINEIGESGFSSPLSVLTLPATPTFTSLEAAISDLTSTQAFLNWEVTGGILDGYYLDISEDPTFQDATMIHEDFESKEINVVQLQKILNLTPGTKYYARIQSFNASGVSPYSQIVPFLTKPQAPTYNQDEVVTGVTQSSATTTWNAVPEILSGYRISISTLDDGHTDSTAFLANYNGLNIAKSKTSIQVSGLEAGTNYYAYLVAVNTSGDSELSEKITILTTPASPVFSVETAILSITQNEITFSWDAPEGFYEGYKLEVSTDFSFGNANLMLEGYGRGGVPNELAQSELTTTVSGLLPGQTYFARIRAFNSTGESPNSNILAFTTVPRAPTVGLVNNISQTGASLNWQSTLGANVYLIDLNTSEEFEEETAVFSDFPQAVPFQVLDELSPGTQYYVRVQSSNASGNSGDMEPADFGTTNFLTKPITPEFPASASLTNVSQTSITLNWNEVPEVLDGYYLDIATTINFTPGTYLPGWENLDVSKDSTSMLVIDLTAGSQYYARLRSYNETGVSKSSDALSMLTLPETPALNPVSNISQNTATLSWASVSEIFNGYYLEISTDDSFSDKNQLIEGYGADNIPKVIDKGQTTEFIDNLNAGVSYYARLSSYNDSGSSPWSDPILVLTTPNTPILNEISAIGQTTATVSWSEIAGADNYVVDISQNFFQTLLPTYNALLSANALIDVVGLSPGEEYQIRVRSKNISGESPNSEMIEFLTTPETPVARDASNSSASVFTANWDAADGAEYYVLEVSLDDFQSFHYNEQLGSSSPVKIQDLIAGETYKYRIKAGNSSGESPYSDIIQVVAQNTSQSLSISELEYNDEFSETATSAVINVKFSGGIGDPAVTIRHKEILDASWSDYLPMIEISPTEFEFTILSNMLDDIGVVFEVKANDGVTFLERKNNTIKRTFSETSSEPLPSLELGEWSLISIPYVLDDNLVQSIFNELGDLKYKKRWRLMTYLDGEYQDQGVGFTRIDLGRGYWFNSLNDVTINVGAGQTNSTIPFDMALEQGWNQIGNPYNVSINWDEILDDNSLSVNVSRIIIYNTTIGEFVESSTLDPFSGAFVFADAATVLSVNPIAGLQGARTETSKKITDLDANSWIKTIELKWNGTSREVAAIGMHSSASNNKDEFDKLIVPRFENYLEMYTTVDEYFYPKFSHDIKSHTSEQVWIYDLESNQISGLTSLSWDPSMVNNRGKLWLVDETNGKTTEMSNTGTYSFAMNNHHEFSIHYSEDPNYTVIPTRLTLGDIYPNPVSFRAQIPLLLPKNEEKYELQLRLYNMQGRLVYTIANGQFAPGIHTFELDVEKLNLKDGLYFYGASFKNTSHKPQQKKIIIKR